MSRRPLRHFGQFGPDEVDRLFCSPPREFDTTAAPDLLATSLGATVYVPATRPSLADDLARLAGIGATSAVLCLEDAIPDAALAAAEANTTQHLKDLARRCDAGELMPLTFVRVRVPEQVVEISGALGESARHLAGFVLPKFDAHTGGAFLDALEEARGLTGAPLRAMPVIESPEVIHLESSVDTLLAIKGLLEQHRELVLAVRLGVTDLAGAYGLRRGRELTAYDVPLISRVMAEVVNVLGRADGTGFVVTGPVWEHFPDKGRIFKPQLRQTPFDQSDARWLRHRLVSSDLDGLIRETVLDKAMGLTGKTVIHPSHVPVVHALSVVTREEYDDACDIVAEVSCPDGGGAKASRHGNKMNEAKPHQAWARRTLRRAEVFGVAREDIGFVDLLRAGASDTAY